MRRNRGRMGIARRVVHQAVILSPRMKQKRKSLKDRASRGKTPPLLRAGRREASRSTMVFPN